jgi:EmrB/QacA subfamily drug resistance transporter
MTQTTASRQLAVPARTAASPRSAPRLTRRLALPVLLAGTCLIVLDFFIVNVALAALQRELHAGTSAVEWVVAGYGLTFAVLLLAAGRLGDRLGHRRIYATGLAGFTAASLLCGMAPNITLLLLGRLLQGAAGALISPTVLALITRLYAGPRLPRAIGTYATVMGLAAAGGQLVGGLLLQADVGGLGWRAIFLVNVPIGVAALALVGRCLPAAEPQTETAIDVRGLLLAGAGFTALVLPLVQGRQSGWPWWSLACLLLAPALLVGFAAWQRRLALRGRPVVLEPEWFRDRAFSAGLLTQLAFWCGQASYFLVLALYLQLGRGLSALHAGLVFSILAGAYLLASTRAAALTARHGRRVVVCGALLLSCGHVAAVLAVIVGDGSTPLLAPSLAFAGTGMGLCVAPITATVMSGVDSGRAGAVTGLLATLQQAGNAIGVAAIGIVFFGAAAHGYAHAFVLSSAVLACLLSAVAGLARLLPPGARAQR